MITYAIQDWYRDDNDELVCDDTGYVVEWKTDLNYLTSGIRGHICSVPDGYVLTAVSYCDNTWAPYYNYSDGTMYETLSDLVYTQLSHQDTD